ncbi:NAD(P)-dependent oxidoreductase [Candidatus Bipolaricaulota bacterium]
MRVTRMAEALRVHITHCPPERAFDELLSLLDPKVSVSTGDEVPDGADVLVCGRPSREQLGGGRVRALVIPYAGVPAETRELLLTEFPEIAVHNLHHNAAAAAELALALFLAAAKSLIPVDRRFRQHDWRSRYDGAMTVLLAGKRALVLGLGTIGTRIARACDALGMRVAAVRRRTDLPHPSFVRVHPPDALNSLLPQADVLFVTLPLTDATRGMIGPDELEHLPRTAILVNIARGAIVGERALYEALKDHRLAAAGIDVWYQYPTSEETRAETPPSEFPFHELENVVMSPHRGGAFTVEDLERERMRHLATTLNAMARNDPVPHSVDLEQGY